ncbi:MAG: GGDEF domain-containing protein [Rudaea sp.]|nr:GGDEF domain-containing protein [Rudaea sp.]
MSTATSDVAGNAGALTKPRSHAVPRQLSEAEFKVLSGAGPSRKFNEASIIFRKGELGHAMFLIESGTVRIEFGEGLPHKLLGAREFFGELALFIGNHARVAGAVAHTPCSLRVIEAPAFDHLLDNEPAMLAQFMRRSFAYLVASEQQLIANLKRHNEHLLATLDSLRQTQTQLSTANRLVRTDELTGLTNRRGLYQFLENLAEHRVEDTQLGLLLIDLDHFKGINDQHGHLVGDEVLRAVADEVSRVAAACDLPCRLGGDEFALLAQVADVEDLRARAEKIVAAVRALHVPASQPPPAIAVSIGGSLCADDADWSVWYSLADDALYRAKGDGGDNWHFYQA